MAIARILFGFAVLGALLLIACSTEGEPATNPTSPATATPAAAESPEVIHGVEVVPLQVGDEVELPDGMALIVETGCFECDGQTSALVRVYRDTSGDVRMDTLFTAAGMGLPPRRVTSSKEGTYTEQPYIHSFALNSGASEIVVSVCSRGDCAWMDAAGSDAQTVLYRSRDGGVSWTQSGTLDGEHFIVAIVKDGILLARYDPARQWQTEYQLYPSGDPIDPPAGAGEGWPLSLPSGELIWPTEDGRLLRSDGSDFLAIGEGASVSYTERNVELDPSGERLAVVECMERPDRLSTQCYLSVVSLSGELIEAFSIPAGANVGGWPSSRLALGTVWFSADEIRTPVPDRHGNNLPAVLDLDAARMHPIPYPFLDPPFAWGRTRVQAVLAGPFARVVNTGACLNVRAQPGTAGEVLECAADGVLLQSTDETQEIDDVTWLRVVTPAGAEGWASTQYLEE